MLYLSWRLGMATAKEIKEHLAIALKEVGKITPWFDKEVNAWVFSHKAYPVEYAGESPEEVKKNYPLYLKEFIKEKLNNNLAPSLSERSELLGVRRSAPPCF